MMLGGGRMGSFWGTMGIVSVTLGRQGGWGHPGEIMGAACVLLRRQR